MFWAVSEATLIFFLICLQVCSLGFKGPNATPSYSSNYLSIASQGLYTLITPGLIQFQHLL